MGDRRVRRPVAVTDRDTLADRTASVLAWLRVVQAPGRDKQRRSLAYTLYCTALLFAIWGVPLLLAAARAGVDGRFDGPVAERLLSALPVLVPAVLASAVLLPALRGRWQGPVSLDRAALTWPAAQPILRRALLLPRFTASAVVASAIGAAVGAVLGFLLYTLSAGGGWPLTGAGAAAGAVSALAGTSLAVLVQRYGDTVLARRPWILRAARAAVAVLWSAAGVSLVYGPWYPQAIVLVLGAAGAVAAVLGTAVAVRYGVRAVPDVPARVLRAQAGTALRIRASLYALDPRQARAAVRATRSRTSRGVPRLPFPRRPGLVVPWRDATALLRAPGRLVWALVWAAVAVALLALSPSPDGAPVAVTLMALPAAYLAAAQLAESARVETDDPRRAAQLPWTPGQLARRHALVPAVSLTVLFGCGGAVAFCAGRWSDGLLLLPALVPALVGAALVNAYRGTVPAELLIGSMTPLGDTGPLGALLWQVRGPLVALVCLALVDGPARGAAPDPLGLLWPLVVGAGMLWWAGATARGKT